MEQLSIDIEGRRIAYLDTRTDQGGHGGPDGPVIVFVHGNSSSAKTWLPVIAGEFGRRFRCLALDLPGHGRSAPAMDEADYSLPGYAAVLDGFVKALDVRDAVVVGWSLGGQIALEAAPVLPDARGFVIFGAPPVASPAQMAEAFLPNPAIGALFSAEVTESEATRAAESFTAPGSSLDTGEFVSDILSTDGAARTGLGSSAGAGRFRDEIAVVAALRRPLAVLHGADEQLVSLDYLRKQRIPALWQGEVQVIAGAGHAPHQEAPQHFAALLTQFVLDVSDEPSPAGRAT